MSQYATDTQFTAVYSVQNLSTAQINTFLQRASDMVNARLGGVYTVPFSSNNATARLLTVDIAMYMLRVRSLAPGDSAELKDSIDDLIASLVDGGGVMATDSGAILSPVNPGREVWGSHASYKPVFDMRDSEDQRVDPDLIDALDAQDT